VTLLHGAREPRAEPGRNFGGLTAEAGRIEATGGRLGVAVLNSGTGVRVAHRGDERFPTASTLKLLLASAVLSRVDAGPVGDRTGGDGCRTSNVVGLLWPPDAGSPRLLVAVLTKGPADATARDVALAEGGAAVAAARAA
jgi:hypothetical protein